MHTNACCDRDSWQGGAAGLVHVVARSLHMTG